MPAVLGTLLPIAVAAALSAVPILVMLFILLAPKRSAAALLYAIGWLAGLVVVTAVCTIGLVALPARNVVSFQPPFAIATMVLGAGLFAYGIRGITKASDDTEPELPKWITAVGAVGPLSAFWIGFGLNLRPKAVVLAVAAGLAISSTPLSVSGIAIATGVYAALGASTIVVPVVMTLISPDRMHTPLIAMRNWITKNNRTITVVVLIMVGVLVFGTGLTWL
jgi:hypothetical protein